MGRLITRLHSGRRNTRKVFRDEPVPPGPVTWKTHQEDAARTITATGEYADGVKVKLRAKMDGSWMLRIGRFPPGLFAPIEHLVTIRGQVAGTAAPGDDGLLGLALVTLVDELEARGLQYPDIPFKRHAVVERDRAAAQAAWEVEKAERLRQLREEEAREQRALRAAERVSGAAYEAGARKAFGLTEDPRLAGFILSDGDMLYFGDPGGHSRARDHREVGMAHPKALGGTQGMRIFQHKTGAIRLGVYGDMAFFDAVKPVTRAQVQRVAQIVRGARPDSVELAGDSGERREEIRLPSVGEVMRASERFWGVA